MNALSFFGILSTLFGGLGIAYAFFRVGKARTIIDLLTEENAALTNSRIRLEQENVAQAAVIKTQEGQIETLKNMTQGSPQLAAIRTTLTRLTKEVSRLTKLSKE